MKNKNSPNNIMKIGSAILTIYLIVLSYRFFGLPISKTQLMSSLPIIISLMSLFFVFYNINRTQKINNINELNRFRRDARIKVADEMIDIMTGLYRLKYKIEDISIKIQGANSFDAKVDEISPSLSEIGEELNKNLIDFEILINQKKHIINYSEFYSGSTDFLTDKISVKLNILNNQIFYFNVINYINDNNKKELMIEHLKKAINIIEELFENEKNEIVEKFYGSIFEPRIKTQEDNIKGFLNSSKFATIYIVLVFVLAIIALVSTFIIK